MPTGNECNVVESGIWLDGAFVPWNDIETATIIDDESVPHNALLCSFNDGYGKEYRFDFKLYSWQLARIGRELMGWKARGPVRCRVLNKLRVVK